LNDGVDVVGHDDVAKTSSASSAKLLGQRRENDSLRLVQVE
jgi:hypothetical protein